MKKVISKSLLVLLAAASLAGCATQASQYPVNRSAAPLPVEPYTKVQPLLTCIKESGAMDKTSIAVGVFTDATGQRSDYGTQLPQGGTSSVLADALMDTGATTVDLYENTTEQVAQKVFGVPGKKVKFDYVANGIFNSLDMGTNFNADVRVAGLGPKTKFGFAHLTMRVQIAEQGTKILKDITPIKRTVRYTKIGASVGKVWGDTLVTGEVSAQQQEMLQFEAIDGPIALGVAISLINTFPRAKAACGSQLAAYPVNR